MTCQHYKPKESRAMAAQGFAICALGPRWQFNAPTHSCDKHERAPAEVIEARRAWAMKGRK
jgi:hypothetical protein